MDRNVNSLAGVFPPNVREPLRALSGVAHVGPSKTWKRQAVRMVDLLLGGMPAQRVWMGMQNRVILGKGAV